MIKEKYFGTRDFYKATLAIAVPIMIQNGISNFVNLLDNLMIGRVGTDALSGVAIANQLIFVFYLLIFGATAGVGIYTAQYYGMGDTKGVRDTFRTKIVFNVIFCIASIIVFYTFSEPLINLFLQGEGDSVNVENTLAIGKQYMNVMLIGLIPVGLTNAYSGTLRDCGETRVPMISSIIAITVNLVGNFILIYGYFGLPAFGATGAAIATVISRFVELGFLAIYTATHGDKHPFIIGAFKHFYIPGNLLWKFFIRSLPLILNETLWAMGNTVLTQCYSYRSLDAVAALNIEGTVWNLISVAFMAMGDAVGIIVGQTLGSGKIDEAKDTARKMIVMTFMFGIICGLVMVIISPFFPMIYNTTPEIKSLATKFLLANGILTPLYSFTHASYFTIRSGGKTVITFIFDSCFVWIISVPTAFILSRYTNIDVVLMLILVQSWELIKCFIGAGIVHSGIWANNIVEEI